MCVSNSALDPQTCKVVIANAIPRSHSIKPIDRLITGGFPKCSTGKLRHDQALASGALPPREDTQKHDVQGIGKPTHPYRTHSPNTKPRCAPKVRASIRPDEGYMCDQRHNVTERSNRRCTNHIFDTTGMASPTLKLNNPRLMVGSEFPTTTGPLCTIARSEKSASIGGGLERCKL